jgi:hypothetical protein
MRFSVRWIAAGVLVLAGLAAYPIGSRGATGPGVRGRERLDRLDGLTWPQRAAAVC